MDAITKEEIAGELNQKVGAIVCQACNSRMSMLPTLFLLSTMSFDGKMGGKVSCVTLQCNTCGELTFRPIGSFDCFQQKMIEARKAAEKEQTQRETEQAKGVDSDSDQEVADIPGEVLDSSDPTDGGE